MPRLSAAALQFPRVNGSLVRLSPPDGLDGQVATVFRSIVASCDARHFTQADLPLLIQFCEACVMADKAAEELRNGPIVGGKVSPWLVVQEKSVRALTALSLRLRICPQARQDPKTASRRSKGRGPSAYELEHDNDE